MVGARWLGMDPIRGRCFYLVTASLSQLSYEHALRPVIRLWNETNHAG